MKDRLLATLCLGLGLVVAGCTPPTSEWTDAQAPKKLHVDYVRLQHSTAFTPGSADLAAGAAEDLDAFLEESEVTPEDHLYFEAASEDSLTAGRIAALTRAIGRRGVGAKALPPSPKDVPPDHMIVYVERYVVTPPDCPNWSKPSYGDHSNSMPSNYGCADVTNLGLMVADPRDLVVGRPLGPSEGNQATAGIARYRNCKVKPVMPMSTAQIYASLAQGGGNSDCEKQSIQ